MAVVGTDATPYSSVNCIGSTLHTGAWKVRSCHYKHICWNQEANRFEYYERTNSTGVKAVSLAPQNAKWPLNQYDATMKWVPVVQLKAKPSWREAADARVHVLFSDFVGSNVGHLMWDTFMPWWGLARQFGLAVDAIQPVEYDQAPSNPAWATCPWIKQHEGPGHSLPTGYSKRCSNNYRRWAPTVLNAGRRVESVAEWGHSRCFADLVVGAGAMSDHCLGKHERYEDDEELPCGNGRSVQYWAFRTHVVDNLRLATTGLGTRPVVYFAERTSNRLALDFDALRTVAKTAFNNSLVVKHGSPVGTAPRDQIQTMLEANILVVAAGGGAMPGMFLPMGSTIVLYHKDNLFNDYKFFNNAAWLKTIWISSDEATNAALFVEALGDAVARFYEYRSLPPSLSEADFLDYIEL